MKLYDFLLRNDPIKNASNYKDKYGAVDYAAWDKAIADIPDFEKRTRQVAYQKDTRGGSVTRYRTEEYDYSNAGRKKALTQAKSRWAEENKYTQQTLNQQIMSGAAQNENIANTSVNELDTAQSDNIDPAVTSVGKKKKTQGSLSTSLGL